MWLHSQIMKMENMYFLAMGHLTFHKLSKMVTYIMCVFFSSTEFPPEILDAAKGKSAEARKAWLDERALIVKQAFWLVMFYFFPHLFPHHCF